MSNTFYVVLPSNVTDYPDNRPNRYRVHLPRPLHLTGNYVCALYSIQYPLSWPSTIGTLEPQWIDLKIREDHPIGEYRSVRIPVPSASLKKPTELVEHLAQALKYAQKEVNSTTMRMRREASSGGDGDEIPPPIIPQPTASGALCIRRGKRVRCQRQSPIPIEEQQQQKTKVKRKTTTPPPASPPSADSPEVNVQNFVTVNVSVEPAKIQKAPPSSPKTSTSSSASVGSISVSVKPFDDEPKQQQPEQKQQPKNSSKPIEDFQAAFEQLTDLIGSIKIEYLKNVNGREDQQDSDDDDDDDDNAVGNKAKRGPSRGFENDRFRVRMIHPSISHMEMSEQLAYVLGFPNPLRILDGEIARYAADLHGGFSSFAVYAQGLTEDVILGNSLSSLLRIVAVEGDPAHQRHGALIEKIYDSPMYVKVLPREINEIAIEIRTMTGQFVPFQFGNVTLTLVFRKVINL